MDYINTKTARDQEVDKFFLGEEELLDPNTENRLRESWDEEYTQLSEIKHRINLEKYKLTPEKYAEMLEAQNGVCAICRKKQTPRPTRFGIRRRLAVDHCHKTGKVRGLLCYACNYGLGVFQDDTDALIRAAEYLNANV